MNFRQILTNGVRLNVAELNPQGDKTVVLLHGFPEFWQGWEHQANYLALNGFHVLIPDQRGYNMSEKPKQVKEYAIDVLAQDIIDLIKQTGKEKVYLAGHDWGAMVAWHIAITNPELLHRLVIVNAPHPFVMRKFLKNSLKQRAKSWYAAMFQLPYLPEALSSAFSFSILDATLKNTSRPGTFTESDIERLHEAWGQTNALTSMMNWYRAAGKFPFHYEGDGQVKTPTFIIWGAEDAFLEREMALPSMVKCTGGRLEIVENATHWVLREEPVRTSKLIGQFLGVVEK